MNGRTRKKLYRLVSRRDGEKCAICGITSATKQLVLEHRDNNPKNNDLTNLQLACRADNYRKNPRRPQNLCERNRSISPQPTELTINRQCESEFRKYVKHEVNERIHVPEKDLIDSGAELLNISPITAKRYLDKLCSAAGSLEREKMGKTIVIQYKKTTHMSDDFS